MRHAWLVLVAAAACSKKAPPATPAPPVSYAGCKASLQEGKLDVADACFQQLVAAPDRPGDDPAQRANALFALSSIRQERGDARGAVRFAVRAVARRPYDEEAQQALAELAHDAGDRAIERAALEKLVELDPDALDRRLQLGGVLAAQKLDEEAKRAFLGYEDARVRLLGVLGRDPDVERRRAAARALAIASDAGTARALVLAMTDKDAGVRAAAVRSVAAVGLDIDPEVRPALVKLRGLEKDPTVLAELRETLTAKKTSDAPSATKK